MSVAQLYPTLCSSMNCRLPGSSVQGILQAIGGSSRPRDQMWVKSLKQIHCFKMDFIQQWDDATSGPGLPHLSAISSHIRSVPRQLLLVVNSCSSLEPHMFTAHHPEQERFNQKLLQKMRWSPVLRSISHPIITILIGPCAHLWANPVLGRLNSQQA